MNNLKALGLGAVAGAALLSLTTIANAGTYDFSYHFDLNPPDTTVPVNDTITGSFSGDQSGQNVTNISNINISLDGSPLGGTFFAYSYTGPSGGPNCPTCFAQDGGTASFDPTKNNFLFGNASTLAAVTTWFYIIQPWINGSETIAVQYNSPTLSIPPFDPKYGGSYNGLYNADDWTLTATPLPSSWTMMLLGLAGVGFVACRRQKRNTSLVTG